MDLDFMNLVEVFTKWTGIFANDFAFTERLV